MNTIARRMEELRKLRVDALLSKPGNYIADGKAYVFRCPECCRENLPEAISSGTCGWCGWSAKK